MKKNTKTIIALSFSFALLLAGALTVGSSYVADLNEGVLLAHDGPTHDFITH